MYRCSTVPPVYFVCSSSCRVERLERVVGEADRQLRASSCSTASRACPPAGCPGQRFRSSLANRYVVPSAGVASRLYMWPGLLLERDDPRAQVVEQAHGERVAPRRGDVVVVAGEVADHLVDAVDADRREVVAQRAEVALGVREQALVDVAAGSPCASPRGCPARSSSSSSSALVERRSRRRACR